ncbi:MAG: shikimate kinase [Flavobacteriaceae bacterium]|jgi:shikimate kinase|tara:strand:+ start:155 stop:685 length:531 start_codon:yes stop_codon:yes gene_type:complete
MVNSHIVVLGYMGCGKTTVSNKLKAILDLPLFDLDQFIENEFEMTISEIFNTKGQIEFRRIENRYLKILLNKKEKSIISLGGGTPCYHDNMDLILKYSKNVFFINTSAEFLSERLFKERGKRPIIKSINSVSKLKEFISKHLFERIVFYNKANYIILDSNQGIDHVCKKIIKKLNL